MSFPASNARRQRKMPAGVKRTCQRGFTVAVVQAPCSHPGHHATCTSLTHTAAQPCFMDCGSRGTRTVTC